MRVTVGLFWGVQMSENWIIFNEVDAGRLYLISAREGRFLKDIN
jgi:hypothetical protein